VPGRSPSGKALCVGCAGITTRSFDCSRCGREFALRHRICEYCFLGDRLDEILIGPIDLEPLRAALLDVDRPDSLLVWLRNNNVQHLLGAISCGAINLTHESLDQIPTRHAADHLRSILVACALLPTRDEVLARYDRWVTDKLATTCSHPDDQRVLKQFVQWHQRRNLETKSLRGPLRPAQINTATQTLREAGKFLDSLRGDNAELRTCTQGHIDRWIATPPTTRTLVRPFVIWARDTNQTPNLVVAHRQATRTPVLDQPTRIAAIARCLDADRGEPWARAAALLVLLYAQPLHAIVALQKSALVEIDTELRVTLGPEPTPVPSPFDTPFRQLLRNRPNQNLYNNTSTHLFPGRNAGHHITTNTARNAVVQIIGKILPSRNAAIRQLVTDCPPPIVAAMLGYSDQTTTNHATAAGSNWTTYAAIKATQQ